MRIFISYGSDDRQRALELASRLEWAGHQAFIDQTLHSGSDFSLVIADEIDQADYVVVLWTSNSVKSRWVIDEAERGRNKLLPVRFGVEPPLGFGAIHTPNLPLLSGADDIVHAIGLGPPRPKQPPPCRWM